MKPTYICEVEKYDELLYKLIFGDNNIEVIVFDEFCHHTDRLLFKDEIRHILKVAKIKILDDRIIHTETNLKWKLEIKRL